MPARNILPWVLSSAMVATAVTALPLPGGGPEETDCHAEFASTLMRLNHPPHDPAAPAPGREVRCFDGDPGCDLDGETNGVCSFDVDVCLYNADPALAGCSPSEVITASATGADGLDAALQDLLPAAANACTSGQTLEVPVSDALVIASIGVEVTTADVTDSDELVLGCVPHGWPSHGFNYANHRSNPLESGINSDNAGALAAKWQFDIGEHDARGNLKSVTGTPAVGFGKVFVPSWNGVVYAVDQDSGELVWQYQSPVAPVLGLQGSPTLTADGRLILASDKTVECLDASDGRLLWSTFVSQGHRGESEMWGAATVANGRVFIGIASAADAPCASDGQLAALDLDTGEILWRYVTTPESVCRSDTSVECTSDTDCPLGGECIPGIGAGITSRPATSSDGETVFTNTVGCFTSPSIGDSDSLLAFDAATGERLWINRVQPPEQFGFCPLDNAKECRNDADCDFGMCRPKGVFHDFGFLNGPLYISAEDSGLDKALVVSGSKDGTLYAVNASDGEFAWRNPIIPAPVSPGLASWGLFNGAIAFSDGAIFAGLHDVAPSADPEHMQSFHVVDGASRWSQPFELTWGDTSVANGVMYLGDCGTNTTCNPTCRGRDCEPGNLYVIDGSDGSVIKKLALNGAVAGGPAIVDGVVYAPYGTSQRQGGVVAFALSCPCDCNFDGQTSISELTRGVALSLGRDVEACAAIDNNGDGVVTVNELVLGVRAALEGCEAFL